jgi:hypothetical protein
MTIDTEIAAIVAAGFLRRAGYPYLFECSLAGWEIQAMVQPDWVRLVAQVPREFGSISTGGSTFREALAELSALLVQGVRVRQAALAAIEGLS